MESNRLFRIGGLIQDLADVSTIWDPKIANDRWTVFVETHRGMKYYERFATEGEAWFFHDEIVRMWTALTNPSSPGSSEPPQHP